MIKLHDHIFDQPCEHNYARNTYRTDQQQNWNMKSAERKLVSALEEG